MANSQETGTVIDPGSLVCVGVIAGAHGVRGAVRVKSYTDDPDSIADYAPLYDKSGTRTFTLSINGHTAKGQLIARITEVSSRNEAENLRGEKLYALRDMLPDPDDEEFYHADLIGLKVDLENGETLGTVRAVYDFGAGDTLEVQRPVGKSVLIPFTREIVPEVHLSEGRLVAFPPEGLLDAPKPEDMEPRSGPKKAKRQNAKSDGKKDGGPANDA